MNTFLKQLFVCCVVQIVVLVNAYIVMSFLVESCHSALENSFGNHAVLLFKASVDTFARFSITIGWCMFGYLVQLLLLNRRRYRRSDPFLALNIILTVILTVTVASHFALGMWNLQAIN